MEAEYITVERLIGNELIIKHNLQQFKDLNTRLLANRFYVCSLKLTDEISYIIVGESVEKLIRGLLEFENKKETKGKSDKNFPSREIEILMLDQVGDISDENFLKFLEKN